tara:strand:+ start:535 stop:1137 length:603 start_codon:yes stop_codon:yes gene_type:complete
MQAQFYHWGPLLFHARLTKDELKKLKKIILKEKSHHKKLAGINTGQFIFKDKEKIKFTNIIHPYLKEFIEVHKFYFNHYNAKNFYIDMIDVWSNFMRPGDANPIHIHQNCDWSSVLYIDIPAKLRKEQERFEGTGCGPGGISFLTGGHINGFVNLHYFKPKNGDFFIFPKELYHYVAPFKAECTRVSLAANFYFREQEIK